MLEKARRRKLKEVEGSSIYSDWFSGKDGIISRNDDGTKVGDG